MMIKKMMVPLLCILETKAITSPIYVTDGTNLSPPGAVYSINMSTNSATETISNSLIPPFARPLGVALSPEGDFAYVTDWESTKVYYINVPLNTATQLVTGSFGAPNGIAISSDSSFAYLADYGGDAVYRIEVATNSTAPTTNPISPFHGPVVPAISLDASFAYVSTVSVPAVFRIDPVTNTVTAQVDGNFQYPIGIAISTDGSKAYVADSIAAAIFAIDTNTNIATKYALPEFHTPYGMSVSTDGKILYVADPGAQSVFYFDTVKNEITRQIDFGCAYPDWAISTIAISPDGNSLYVTGGNAANLWHIDIASGLATQITNDTLIPYNSPTSVATLPPRISVSNLTDNNLTMANYLNVNEPYVTLRQIVPLQGSALNNALEMMAPTRNAFATFASQTTQIGLSRLVNTHQRQNRWTGKASEASNRQSVMANSDAQRFLASSSKMPPSSCTKDSTNYSLWGGVFGEYMHEKAEHQTPDFSATSLGGVLAWDFHFSFPSLLGMGAAYAYTHLHEEEGFGNANIQQGDLFFYGTFPFSKGYLDAALWGGYYHLHNERKIAFSNVHKTATLKTHGWQLTPHLEAGYDYRLTHLGIEPFAMIDWVNSWELGASETGAVGFNMHQKGRYSSLLRTEAGVRFEETSCFGWGTISWMEKVGYAYQKTFHTGKINAFLIGSSNGFTVSTLRGAQNLGVAELEVLFDAQHKAYPYASLNGHFEVGSKYQSYQGVLEIGKEF